MSPLTPGCQALVLKGSKAGSVITCVKHIGFPKRKDVQFNAAYDCWEVDPLMPWTSIVDIDKTIMLNIFPTKFLMKIDGHQTDVHDQVHKVLEKST